MLVGVVPDSLYDKVKENVVAMTEEKHKGHIAVGLVGSTYPDRMGCSEQKSGFLLSDDEETRLSRLFVYDRSWCNGNLGVLERRT